MQSYSGYWIHENWSNQMRKSHNLIKKTNQVTNWINQLRQVFNWICLEFVWNFSRSSVALTAMWRPSVTAKMAASASSTRRTERRAKPVGSESVFWWECPRAAPVTADAPTGSRSTAFCRSKRGWTPLWVRASVASVASLVSVPIHCCITDCTGLVLTLTTRRGRPPKRRTTHRLPIWVSF